MKCYMDTGFLLLLHAEIRTVLPTSHAAPGFPLPVTPWNHISPFFFLCAMNAQSNRWSVMYCLLYVI